MYLEQFKSLYYITNIPKLRSFQYRLLHRALVLNTHLYHWGKRQDALCTFCDSEKETLVHIMIGCDHVRSLWYALKTFIEEHWDLKLEITPESILWHHRETPQLRLISFMCIITKQYIHLHGFIQGRFGSEIMFLVKV